MIKTFFAFYSFGIVMTMIGYTCCMYEISLYVATAISVGVTSVGIIIGAIAMTIFTAQDDA